MPIYELCNLKLTVRNLFPLSKRRSPAGEIYLEGKFSPNQQPEEFNARAGPEDRYQTLSQRSRNYSNSPAAAEPTRSMQ